ncbi:hypothetical protein J3F84DRAFT_385710, partial [Trichoderma pleuroticola]
MDGIDYLFANIEQLPTEFLLLVIDVIDYLQGWLHGMVDEDVPLNAWVYLDAEELLDYRPRYAPNSRDFPQNHRARATSRYRFIQQPPARRGI